MQMLARKEDLSSRWLKRDELGIAVFPTVDFSTAKEKQPTPRDKRMVCNRTHVYYNLQMTSVLKHLLYNLMHRIQYMLINFYTVYRF